MDRRFCMNGHDIRPRTRKTVNMIFWIRHHEMTDKIAALVQMRQKKGLSFDIEVDGGIDDKTIASAKEAGANVFVAGSYLFKGDLQTGVNALRAVLND